MSREKTSELKARMRRSGKYCVDLVAHCLREAGAVGGVPQKDIDLCLRDSETYAAAEAHDPVWMRFVKERAVPAAAFWTQNFSQQIRGGPASVLVDRESGIFLEKATDTYGCLADIESCLTYGDSGAASSSTGKKTKPRHELDNPSDIEEDLKSCQATYRDAPETEREAIIAARRGQGRFRAALIELWAGKCAVTKSRALSLLRASHIKPWRDCTNAERLDRHNGLLLIPNLDAAFDLGLISFADDGGILISPELKDEDAKLLGIKRGLKLVCVFEENKPFLAAHRQLHGFPS
jgi:HNH endonuclease